MPAQRYRKSKFFSNLPQIQSYILLSTLVTRQDEPVNMKVFVHHKIFFIYLRIVVYHQPLYFNLAKTWKIILPVGYCTKNNRKTRNSENRKQAGER